MRNFGGLGGEVGQIVWGSTPAENIAILKRITQQVCEDLYDNGQPGLITRVEAHMSEAIGASIEQRKQHESNSRKLNVIMVLAALMALVISVVGIFVTVEISKHGTGELRMLHSSTQTFVAIYQAKE